MRLYKKVYENDALSVMNHEQFYKFDDLPLWLFIKSYSIIFSKFLWSGKRELHLIGCLEPS